MTTLGKEAAAALVLSQHALLDRLNKHLINFKKDGADRQTKRHFDNRIEKIREIYTEFMTNNNSLHQSELPDNDDYFAKDLCEEFENAYIDVLAQVQTKLDILFPSVQPNPLPNASSTPNHASANATINPNNVTMAQPPLPFKIPKFAIPQFSGAYTDWPEWYDQYLQIHKLPNETLDVNQKFQILKNALNPKVKTQIGHLNITRENYDTAFEALIKRYNNGRVLFSNYMEKFLNQKSISVENAEELSTLYDVSLSCVFAMKKLGVKTDECGEIFAHILLRKLPKSFRLDWEKDLGSSTRIPNFEQLIDFIDTRYRTLESVQPQTARNDSFQISTKNSFQSQSHSVNKTNVRKDTKSFHVSAKNISCPICQKPHPLRKCYKFLHLSASERQIEAEKHRICTNCLGHKTSESCHSNGTCKECKSNKHHTLLHINQNSVSSNAHQSASNSTENHNLNSTTSSHVNQSNQSAQLTTSSLISNNLTRTNSNYVLLATALVDIRNSEGEFIRLRALVDQGGQHSIITERAHQRLKLKSIPICIGVKPMGESQYKIVNKGLHLTMHSIIDPSYTVKSTCAIIPSVTNELPLVPLKTSHLSHLQNLPLADPHFNTPGPIDILLAGDVYGKIIQEGLRKGAHSEPIAQQTTLGWILSGELAHHNHFITQPVNCFHVSVQEINDCMKKFYEIEEVPATRTLSKEDAWTEQFFENTYQRHPNGKFSVRLPFKSYFDSNAKIGASYDIALKRFKSLQRRFDHDTHFRDIYTNAINEYKNLNQMKLVDTIYDQQASSDCKHFYLPHHAVFKASSLTTKIRPVFDASAKTTNGKSLNDILTTGPALQSDPITMLINWRFHKFVFIADIGKMYRCIDLQQDDTNYHLILWKDDESSGIRTYALQTVTFGVASSAYLAIKTLHKLAELEQNNYPLACKAIKNSTYVDDIISGGETKDEAIRLVVQLIQMLRGGGFELRKWSSNATEILKHIPIENQNQETEHLLNSDESVKTLGLCWNTACDEFSFHCNIDFKSNPLTKRATLSIIARLYDPLGWINPFITKAKIFLSKLWQENLDWDQPFSAALSSEWTEICSQLDQINRIKIPRWLSTSSKNIHNELHVFCDSSQHAYSVAIYLRTIDSNNNIHSNIIIAKSKLTPVRKPLTIPRAELCGAVLAVKMLTNIKNDLQIKINNIFMWTDSAIVLSWIRGDPNRWSVFVCNRVNRILQHTEIAQWHHVVSKDNSADCNSRGLHISQLIESSLWWHGPHWLLLNQSEWPESPFNFIEDDQSELKSKFKSINLAVNEISHLDHIVNQFSSFDSLRRSIAYCLRFVQCIRNSIKSNAKKPATINKNLQLISPLTVKEIQNAEISFIKWLQSEVFHPEIIAIRNSHVLPKNSKLSKLNPFLDAQNILRVNGRLINAHMPFNEKFPIIIPSNHRIVHLIVKLYHALTLHGGPRLTVNQTRQNYWILNVRNFARHFIQKCTVCFSNKPKLLTQQMGALPFNRVNDRSRPFAATTVDYAGPFRLKASQFRGIKSYKGYVAIFTCMATKAVHLEAAGDMTAQTFIHTFERFIARRGYCHDMYSDNGTNFVRAFKDMDKDRKLFENSYENIIKIKLIPYLATRNIQWHFSPPYSPHFNGLAEAAVKSMKFHIVRTIAESTLSFEHFSTVLARIEAVLNSRPISAISDNINDFTSLTPGHFLIGNSLLARPHPPSNEKLITRYQQMEAMVQHFWHRFRMDVLSSMQIRNKWQSKQPNIKVGDLVIVKEDNIPVNCWPLARVEELHPGSDGLIRVATIRFSDKSLLKRSIAKLCLLPIETAT